MLIKKSLENMSKRMKKKLMIMNSSRINCFEKRSYYYVALLVEM